MNKLTFIALLEKQINQEIIRLGQSELVDWEKEQTRLTIQVLAKPVGPFVKGPSINN